LSSFVLAVVYAIITQVANLIFVHERLQLTKQTNIQATGVASSLVQIIEQAGFKMQALSLGFDEDDDEDDEFIDYDPSTYVEEEEVIAA
jgi:putative NIF3 family GTP cyclohydrolase 1 type 2